MPPEPPVLRKAYKQGVYSYALPERFPPAIPPDAKISRIRSSHSIAIRIEQRRVNWAIILGYWHKKKTPRFREALSLLMSGAQES